MYSITCYGFSFFHKQGNAVNAFSLNGTIFPLIDAKEATKDCKDYGDM
jgi:hypothetical protein